MTASSRMDFAHFGQQFMDLIVTPSMLAQALDAAVTPKELHEEISQFRGIVDIVTDSTIGGCEIVPYRGHVFGVKLPITVNVFIRFPVGTEHYRIQADVPLWLEMQAWTPLVLYAAIHPVAPEDIQLQVEDDSWLGIAEKVGGLEGQVKDTLAQRVNATLDRSEGQRTIDVYAMVQKVLSPGSPAAPPPRVPSSLPEPPDVPQIAALRAGLGPKAG